MIHNVVYYEGKMRSVTIHGVDEPLAELITSKAQAEGLSISQSIKIILESSLGVKARHYGSKRGEFEEFCGISSDDNLTEFKEKTQQLRKVDYVDRW
jgi:hypothetical protein